MSPTDATTPPQTEAVETVDTVDEIVIEEVSIDGMCGVY